MKYLYYMPCFGAGWIRIIWPDPDPLQKALIRIRVGKKIVINYETEKSTKFRRIKFFKKRNHLFSLIYVNNELINQKKNIDYEFYTGTDCRYIYYFSIQTSRRGGSMPFRQTYPSGGWTGVSKPTRRERRKGLHIFIKCTYFLHR